MRARVLLIIISGTLLVSACSNEVEKEVANEGDSLYNKISPFSSASSKKKNNAHLKQEAIDENILNKTAQSINHSFMHANAIQQEAHPPQRIGEPPPPSSYQMNIPASVNWDGPIKPLLEDLLAKTGYKLHVLGHEPDMPIIVNVHKDNTTIGDLIRDAGLQCGDKAQVVVVPSQQTVELRYQTQG